MNLQNGFVTAQTGNFNPVQEISIKLLHAFNFYEHSIAINAHKSDLELPMLQFLSNIIIHRQANHKAVPLGHMEIVAYCKQLDRVYSESNCDLGKTLNTLNCAVTRCWTNIYYEHSYKKPEPEPDTTLAGAKANVNKNNRSARLLQTLAKRIKK